MAAAVRGEIAEQGVKRGELAKAAGMSPDKLRHRLSGKQPFYVDEFITLCHILKVPVAEMLDRAGVK